MLKTITCPRCGESRLHEENGVYVCDVCEATLTVQEEMSLEEKLLELRKLNQEIDLGSLRFNIRNEMAKSIRDYKIILPLAMDILKILPEDFQALYLKNLCTYKTNPFAYDAFLFQAKDTPLSDYEKLFLYPFIIDECQYRSKEAVIEFLKGQGDYEKYQKRLEKAMKQRELENDLFANIERDVFICHSSKDNDKILPIIQAIEKDGYACWYSERNLKKDIDYYYTGIEEAIQSCRIFLVFMSTNAIMSDDVKWEITQAKKYNKNLRIEYRLEDRNNNPQLKEFFAGIQWVDGAYEENSQELIDRIYRELHKEEKKEDETLSQIKLYLYLEDYSKAKDLLEKKLAKEFDNPLLYELGIQIESQNQKKVTPIALKYYERLLSLDSANKGKYEKDYAFLFSLPKTSLEEAIQLYEKEEYQKAYQAFCELLDKSDGVAENYIGLMYDGGLYFPIDKEKALSYFERGAKQGNVKSLYNCGYMYEKGEGTQKDEKKAFSYYLAASKQGDSDSTYIVGYDYLTGTGVEQDYQKALLYLSKAAEEGNSLAQYNLGNMYFNGNGVKQDYAQAFRFQMKAALQGLDIAQFNVGRLYQDGLGVEKDEKEKLRWWLKAEDQNYPSAIYSLGLHYLRIKDYQEAYYHFKKGADLGILECLYQVAYLYRDGDGVKQDYEKAREYFKLAAERGYAPAQFEYGYLYDYGIGVNEDLNEAKRWYVKAAAQGNKYAKYHLGAIYLYQNENLKEGERLLLEASSQGVESADNSLGIYYLDNKNYEKAFHHFNKAAKENHPGALYHLGLMYERGDGVKKDIYTAISYYEKATSFGHKMAPNALGNAYRDLGEVDKAIHYYQIAAETGNASSQTSLSCLYDKKGDFKNAAFWAKKAAENGDVLAQYNLGIYYLYGKGVPKNRETARSYFTMAAEQGDEDAIQILANWNEG